MGHFSTVAQISGDPYFCFRLGVIFGKRRFIDTKNKN